MHYIYSIKKYLHFWFTAKRKKGHGVHSPFVFDLITNVFTKKTKTKEINSIEQLRKRLLRSNKSIDFNDFGSGAQTSTSQSKKIASIAKTSLKPKKQAKLLYRIVKYFNYSQIIELGTSLGITTAYLSKANKQANILTFEGCSNVCEIAKQNFEHLNLSNIKLIQGDFKNTLAIELKEIKTIDLVFFDGNHTKKATLNYFEQCLPFIHNETLFVFDDIHWSNEMEEAWEIIKDNAQVKVSIDLFHMGLVFFRKEMTKEHYKIRF